MYVLDSFMYLIWWVVYRVLSGQFWRSIRMRPERLHLLRTWNRAALGSLQSARRRTRRQHVRDRLLKNRHELKWAPEKSSSSRWTKSLSARRYCHRNHWSEVATASSSCSASTRRETSWDPMQYSWHHQAVSQWRAIMTLRMKMPTATTIDLQSWDAGSVRRSVRQLRTSSRTSNTLRT